MQSMVEGARTDGVCAPSVGFAATSPVKNEGGSKPAAATRSCG